MPDGTNSQRQAATDTSSPANLHLVVGYDGSPPASRALDAAVGLLRGRDGSIEVVYVAHMPGVDMMSADAVVDVRADFDEIEKELRPSAAAQLDADIAVLVVGSSSHASHRIIGSVAVGLARHCPVPLVIVP